MNEALHGRRILDRIQEIEQAVRLHEKRQPAHLILATDGFRCGGVKHSCVDNCVASLYCAADGRDDARVEGARAREWLDRWRARAVKELFEHDARLTRGAKSVLA